MTNSLIILEVLTVKRRVYAASVYLANVEIRSENNVIKNLRKNGFVEEIYVSNSPYDLIIKIKAETMDELKEAVHTIRTANQVKSTLTLIMTEE
ncbi:MAG: Lrp/AsnC ligand binding domain-containing protein [Candidatus Bathyarchaeia archaeon]